MIKIREFICTIQGKVLLLVLNVLAVIFLCVSFLGISFMSQMNIYGKTKEDAIYASLENEISLAMHNIAVTQVQNAKENFILSKEDIKNINENLAKDKTSLRYAIYDSKGKIVIQNEEEKLNLKRTDQRWNYRIGYKIFEYSESYDGYYNYDNQRNYENNIQKSYGYVFDGGHGEYNEMVKEAYEVCAYIDEGSQIKDIYYMIPRVIDSLYEMRYRAWAVGAACGVIALLTFFTLMYSAGKRAKKDGIVTTAIYRIPWDLLLIIVGIVIGSIVLAAEFTVFVLLESGGTISLTLFYEYSDQLKTALIWVFLYAFLAMLVFLGFCTSTAVRIKTKNLWKNTVLYRILVWIKRRKLWGNILKMKDKFFHLFVSFFQYLPLMGKTVFVLVTLTFLELFMFAVGNGYVAPYFTFWIFEKLIGIPVILYIVWNLRKLKEAGKRLSSGDLHYQVDTEKMWFELKEHGENLNHIADGMNEAVSEKMKSEHLKTELITNVSHDIKTPLTSIINYADLIGKEKCENETIREYADVLLRQSERLKKLIEDLVEASKASTGNLDVELVPCEAQIFLSQVFGEYEEKLKEKELELIVSQPEKPLFLMADGRRMLRIFDNLMGNIYKYAQPKTRVYISLEERKMENNSGDTDESIDGNIDKSEIVFVFKNISCAALNLSVDELMERFVRGDASRNTEGNGLGLSIAKSLAQLQNGCLDLEIDGDLFKALLRFPSVKA